MAPGATWAGGAPGGTERSPNARTALVVLLVVGAALRIVLDWTTPGNPFDLRLVIARLPEHLTEAPLHVYSQGYGPFAAWVYPPGYFGWVLPADWLSRAFGLDYHGVVRLLGGACDLLIAWAVHEHLRRRGTSVARCLLAAGAVVLGPAFIVDSTIHGQVDTVALTPAVLAVAHWDRRRDDRAATRAGALSGIAAVIKQNTVVAALALLPTASGRQRWRILAGTAAVPALCTLPFLAAEPRATVESLAYRGYPGTGGLSLLLQPGLATRWLSTGFGPDLDMEASWTALTRATQAVAPVVLLVALAAAVTFLVRHRAEPVPAACLLWLVFWVFGLNVFVTYVVWGLPFFLMAGAVRSVVAFQVVWLLPLWITYKPIVLESAPVSAAVVERVYTPLMIVLFFVAVAALLRVGRLVVAGPAAAIPATAPGPTTAPGPATAPGPTTAPPNTHVGHRPVAAHPRRQRPLVARHGPAAPGPARPAPHAEHRPRPGADQRDHHG